VYAEVKVENPNANPLRIFGKVKLKGSPTSKTIEYENTLLMGSTHKGPGWCVAFAIYTGNETKTRLNVLKPRKKMSRIEYTVNKWVLYVLAVLLVIIIFSISSFYALSSNDTYD